MKNSVGIYVPFYNVEKYIIESMKSIKSQSHKDFELIMLDDCSTDNSYNKVKEYLKENPDDRIKLFQNKKHFGLIGKAKNEAISKFTKDHEYICHVGSDDIIPDYCLKTFVDYMNKHPETEVCYGNFLCFDDSGKQWPLNHVANSSGYKPETLLMFMNLFPHRFYRKRIVEKAGMYSEELSSAVDYDLALRISELTDKIHRIKEPITYYYRQHSQQVSTKARPEQDLNAKAALENALKRRGIDGKVINDKPPFQIEYGEEKKKTHFIWGQKE